MDDNQLKEAMLIELRSMLEKGQITKEEIEDALKLRVTTGATEPVAAEGKGTTFTKILYFIGGTIALAGIAFFLVQVWDDIGTFARILVTFGFGLVMTIFGVLLRATDARDGVSQVLLMLGGLLIPGGALVVLTEFEQIGVLTITNTWPFVITYGGLALLYTFLRLSYTSSILTFFLITNSTAFLFLFAGAILPKTVFMYYPEFFQNLIIFTGVGYLILAYAIKEKEHQRLILFLNFFGILGILLVCFMKMFDSGLWEVFFLPLVLVGIAYALFAKSTSSLFVSVLFLMAYFVYITASYFADSIGWPLALICIGFLIIGLGYFSIQLKRRYITSS